MASGLYNTPFAHVAKKSSTEYSHSTRPAEVQESFMEVTRATRHCIYSFMNAKPDSCEVIKVGENKDIDKKVNTYLTHYKSMTRKNVSA